MCQGIEKIGIITAREAVESVKPADPVDIFAHLPPYQPPSSGVVARFPTSIIPYAELMRLHKPAGYYAFLFPHLFGTLLAACSLTPDPPSIQTLSHVLPLLLVSNLFLRGAACTYNDALDGPFDRLVKRCRHRPVARGAVSPFTAHLFALAQTGLWIGTLTLMPPESWQPAMLLAGVMLVYPFCKRWTNFPQVVLGFSLALGQGIGIGCTKVDVMKYADHPHILTGLLAFYLSNVVHAVVYDTVYAYQDIEDDLNAGVMSMAIACLGWTKQWLTLLSVADVGLLCLAGLSLGCGMWYWIFTVCGTAGVLLWMLMDWDVKSPQSCWKWFQWTIWLSGATICSGLFGEYVARLSSGLDSQRNNI